MKDFIFVGLELARRAMPMITTMVRPTIWVGNQRAEHPISYHNHSLFIPSLVAMPIQMMGSSLLRSYE